MRRGLLLFGGPSIGNRGYHDCIVEGTYQKARYRLPLVIVLFLVEIFCLLLGFVPDTLRGLLLCFLVHLPAPFFV
jgi:predicted membrane metal-binding protein